MMHAPTELCMQRAFSVLPLELLLHVLDQLIGSCNRLQLIAYEPSHIVTKTLRNLTLVSRSIYPVASRYLYSYCLYLNNCTNYARFRRTLGLNLGSHPQILKYGESGRNEELFAGIPRYITSAFISPMKTKQDGDTTPLVRLPQIIDLCKTIGLTLKRLALDLQPIYAVASEIELVKPYLSEQNIFLYMLSLEELVVSYDVLEYFPYAPPT
jgi:hypothetical protein